MCGCRCWIHIYIPGRLRHTINAKQPQLAANRFVDTHFYKNMAAVNLDVDEAYLNVTTNFPASVWMYFQTEDCYQCPFERLAEIRSHIRSGEKNTFFVSTKFHNFWRFYRKNMGKYVPAEERRNLVCDLEPQLGEFGVYDFFVGANGKCDVNVARPPIYSSLGMYILNVKHKKPALN